MIAKRDYEFVKSAHQKTSEITPLGAAIIEALPDRDKVRRVKALFKKKKCPVSVIFDKTGVEAFYRERGQTITAVYKAQPQQRKNAMSENEQDVTLEQIVEAARIKWPEVNYVRVVPPACRWDEGGAIAKLPATVATTKADDRYLNLDVLHHCLEAQTLDDLLAAIQTWTP